MPNLTTIKKPRLLGARTNRIDWLREQYTVGQPDVSLPQYVLLL